MTGAMPAAGPHSALRGVRVVDFSALLPGPIATQILADFGADVIKVERPGGDPLRAMMPGCVEAVSRGKRSIVLDMKRRADRETAQGLAARADVVVESSRPGVAERLGIDYASLSATNPALVYCSLSGYGQTGPRRLEPGHDLNYLALSGALVAPGAEGPPTVPLVPVADTLAGAYAASAILATLHSGRGAYLDLALAEAVLAAMAPILSEHVARDRPASTDFPLRPAYGVYETSDGELLCLACTELHFWHRLCEVLGFAAYRADPELETWEGRSVRAHEVDAAIRAALRERTRAHWVAAFLAADLPVTDVNDFDAVLREPQFAERGAVVSSRDAPFVAVGFPALVDGMRPAAEGPAASAGGVVDDLPDSPWDTVANPLDSDRSVGYGREPWVSREST
jgi:crotonobetainyl-CoA:carnitine CoA-transferase CaiB-like acyl-CoA transferase